MNITISKKIQKDTTYVFVVREGGGLSKHAFFRVFDPEDQAVLRSFEERMPLKEGHAHSIFLPSGKSAAVIVTTKREAFTHRKALIAARRVIAYARGEGIRKLTLSLDDFFASHGPKPQKDDAIETITVQFVLANFEFTTYKTPPPDGWKFVEEIYITGKSIDARFRKAISRGVIIGEEINHTRELSNVPGGDMTPGKLALAAKRAGAATGCKVTVLDKKKIQSLKMGGVLGVSQGSSEAPQFIIIEHNGAKKEEAPIVLVGKGVTFDTGGLNLKPEQGIYEMHMDMAGGAAVIHTVAALARLGVKKRIVGLIPAVENMPSGSSYRPGDQLRSMSGKTIEILNTDAEGRVILADALEYAKKYNPKLVVDVATLTGAAVVALGQRTSALFTEDRKLEKQFRDAGEITGDFVWPMPLWEEYEEEVKGTFGDVANMGKYKRLGGAITAAVFLWQFAKDFSWVHIDIAPRMTAIEGDFLAKGSTGPSVHLLAHLIRTL